MDVIRASTVGIDNCIATMGTALTREHKSIIRNMANNVILCFDLFCSINSIFFLVEL